MPGFDQTGPHGQGAMTGRKAGRCTNFKGSLKSEKSESGIKPDNGSNSESVSGRGKGTGMRHGQGGCGRGSGLGRQNRSGRSV